MAPEDREAVNLAFANLGKAIAAFERQLLPSPSRFDCYVEAVLLNDLAAMQAALLPDEVAGLRIFIGKGQCITCHNSPLLTNNDFHNTGVPAVSGLPEDLGRASGLSLAQADAFNCLGRYSDAQPADCAELRFAKADAHAQARQFKSPSLRGVAERPPYMHAGQFATLRAVGLWRGVGAVEQPAALRPRVTPTEQGRVQRTPWIGSSAQGSRLTTGAGAVRPTVLRGERGMARSAQAGVMIRLASKTMRTDCIIGYVGWEPGIGARSPPSDQSRVAAPRRARASSRAAIPAGVAR